MRKIAGIILWSVIIVNVGCLTHDQPKKYYISPNGNDDHPGLTKRTAWKTLERINRETFQPGDAILFESGGTWDGNLHPSGSGERGKMITISSYGKGNKPVINIGHAAGCGITLVDQSWWKIQGIEITSGAPPQLGFRREGISVKAEKEDSIRGIVIRDCDIHDIWGQIGGPASSTMIKINKAGEEITIENNTIKRCDKVGIQVTGRKNIVIRGNYLENLGGDAIIVHYAYRGLIEYNVADQTCLRTGDPYLNTGEESRYKWWPHTAAIWMSHAKETIMQYNEVYHTGRQLGNGDGQAYDFDFGCENNILQYNYSRDNAGFLLIMDNTRKNIARYNISENDIKFRPTQLVTMFCDTTEQNIIHNNVFYVDHGTSDITYYYGDEYGPGKGKGKKDKGKLGAHFRNNIFYATGQGRFRTVYALGDSLNSAEFRKLEDSHQLPPSHQGTRFHNNLYFGPWMNGLPDDPLKIIADPMFVSPGSGRYGLSSLGGYKLRPGSPCFNQAVCIETGNNSHDFYGNPVIKNPTDIGVHEEVDSGVSSKELRENTFLQVSGPWKPSIDIRSDVAIVYGAADSPNMTLKERVQTWKDRGYITQFMTGISWGDSYDDYFYGRWDGKNHLDEAQVARQGDTLWHGKQTPYFLPSMNFLNYFKENHIKKAIDAGIDAIYLEEPEFFAQAGYSEAFKREWKEYYGFDWRPPFDSPENAYLSNKLKHHILCRALEESFTYAKDYGKNKGINVRCYVATHSLLNYTVWEMVSPELSLTFLPNVDGFQCQTWTGTAREPNYYQGKAKERILETAYLEYGSMVPMATLSGRKLTFNIDPIEDRRRDWADYKKNYEANFIAYLLYPTINNFEVMPWPGRIFEGTFPVSSNSDKREKIPRYYSTQMMVMINACNNMPLSDNKLSGSHGISVLMSNSLMFQRWPTFNGYNDYPPVSQYEEPEIAAYSEYKRGDIVFGNPRLSFSDFYGQALPLLKRGVPVQILHLESVSNPEAWKDTKILIMSYSNMKPLSAKYHDNIADWVSKGGVLVYCGRDEDPYQNVTEWWNTGNNHFKAPSEDLFEKLHIKPSDKSSEYKYGDGTVCIIRQDPKEFVLKSNSDQNFVNILKKLYDKLSEDDPLVFKNSFCLERGAYDIIAVLDENVDKTPYVQKGHLIDLFNPQLPVLSEKTVYPGEQALLFNIDRVRNQKQPQVLVTGARVSDEKIRNNSYSVVVKSPLNTENIMRVLLPDAPKKCSIKDVFGKELSGSDWKWDAESKTCLLQFENDPDGIQVELSW